MTIIEAELSPDDVIRPEWWHATSWRHPLSQVDNKAVLGKRTKVWQFASVIRGAIVGDDCSIASCAIVDGSIVGNRCLISHGAFIDPGIVIGNDVFIGPHVSMCNDGWPRVDKLGFDMAPMIDGSFVTTKIEDYASVGANVVILPGITIGAGCMIAAGAVVTKSVPALHLYKRDGSIVQIDNSVPIRRMRPAC